VTTLSGRQALALFVVGAVGGLVGDAAHVQTGTTTYLSDAVPFIWESALWFPVAVGLATVATGDLRLRLGPVAPGPWAGRADRIREAATAIASVLAIYAVSALVSDRPEMPGTVLVAMLAVICVARFASGGPALVCAVAAAVLGPIAEIILVEAGAAEYGPNSDGLFGVALWLPALYFAFGAVVSRLTELLVAESDAAGGTGAGASGA
jgi:hypothetical protein